MVTVYYLTVLLGYGIVGSHFLVALIRAAVTNKFATCFFKFIWRFQLASDKEALFQPA
jgi:hypothetical protein